MIWSHDRTWWHPGNLWLQSNLDYPDFSIIQTFSLVPINFGHEYFRISYDQNLSFGNTNIVPGDYQIVKN